MQGIFSSSGASESEGIVSLANGEALLELTTGSIDIIASGIANGRLDAMHGKAALKSLHLLDGGRLERAVRDVVQLDEIHMAQRTLTEVDERLHLGIRIVDAVDHGELVRGATTGLLGVVLQRLMKTEQGVLLNTGHQLVARGLNC